MTRTASSLVIPCAAVACILLAALVVSPISSAKAQRENVVVVNSDDTVITRSCIVRVHPGKVIADANGNGVILIQGDDITVEFQTESKLRGAAAGTAADRLTGVGIRIDGKRNVTLKNVVALGYKVAVHATRAPGLTVIGGDLSDNYRTRLRSTAAAEDASDWLHPHVNDGNEWLQHYGAALYIEDSARVSVHDVRVRRGQNGIILDRVTHSSVYDNDCSFLSGWGLALFRSSNNVISRNAFDFCIRGYSHGVYNRGQDSAGILMFEQCSSNLIVENSATHGGDGFFAFAGHEALGQKPPPQKDFDYTRRGNNDNRILGNDFSYAAAHGLELTFSFGNQVLKNRLVENGVCGIWGGYSQATLIAGNEISGNGEFAYGLERGGINIEHGTGNRIVDNAFSKNRCGVHLWQDEDAGLRALPWAKANYKGCRQNEVAGNTFDGDELVLQLRSAVQTHFGANEMSNVGKELDADDSSSVVDTPVASPWQPLPYEAKGRTRPVGARKALRGKQAIIMDEWGPWDHQTPLIRRTALSGGVHRYEVFGVEEKVKPTLVGGGIQVRVYPATATAPQRVELTSDSAGIRSYKLTLSAGALEKTVAGTLVATKWTGSVFPWQVDPRKDLDGWLAESRADAACAFEVAALRLEYGMGSPRDLNLSKAVTEGGPGANHFGTIAKCSIPLQAGSWRIKTLSDDGIRVTVDGKRLIDNWTWHAPTPNECEFTLEKERRVVIEVMHFEIDGYAVLTLDLEQID